MTSKASYLAGYVEVVVQDFVCEIDPEEERYKTYSDLGGLRADLEECIEGRVADWQVEQREKHKEGQL